MKKIKLLALSVGIVMLGSLLTACAPKQAEQPSAAMTQEVQPSAARTEEVQPSTAQLEVVDMTGRTVAFASTSKTVVALTASDVEILYALGALDMLVGVGEYCNYPAEALEKTVITSGAETNTEEIIALHPDVVIMGEMAQTEEQVTQLENAGISVVLTDAQDIAGTYEAIDLIGTVIGKSEEAAAIVDSMKASFADLSAKAQQTQGKGKTVYFEVSPLEYGLWTTGMGTFMQEISDMLGLTNIFADVTGWAEISQEQVIERNPDIIVTIAMYFGEGVKPVEEIMSRAGWEDITAIKNGDVFNADGDMLSRPAPRLADGATALYNYVYGE